MCACLPACTHCTALRAPSCHVVSCGGVVRSEEEADRRTIAKLRDKAGQLESQLMGLKVAEAADAAGVKLRPTQLSQLARAHNKDPFVGGWRGRHTHACMYVHTPGAASSSCPLPARSCLPPSC